MDVIKAEGIKQDLKKILILGVPFSNKTGLSATAPRPMLVLAHDVTAERRLAGQKDIDILPCYDKQGELPGSGARRMDGAIKELLSSKTPKYKTISVDPYNYYHQEKLEQYKELSKADTRQAFGQLKSHGIETMKKLMKFPGYVIVICHVRLKEDETTGMEAYLPDIDGSMKDSMPGRFDATLFTEVKGVPPNVKYTVRCIPDSKHTCGIKVPIGKEAVVTKPLPSDLQEIVKLLQ